MPRYLTYLFLSWSFLAALGWGAVSAAPVLVPIAVALLGVLLTVPMIAFFANGVGWRRYPTAAFRLWVVRPTVYAQLLLPVVTGAAGIGLLVGALVGHARAGAQIAAMGALVIGALLFIAGWMGSRALVVRDVEARVRGLPDAFDGLRIAQVSDLHLGPQTSRRFLDKVTRTIRTLDADVVTVTGDLIDDRAEDTQLFAGWLDTLGTPAHGVYLIPGNHDVYAGWAAVHEGLRSFSRAHVLVNDAQVLTRGGALLAIIGLGDPAGRGAHGIPGSSVAPDVQRAFHGVPSGAPVIAFAHNPALWPSIAQRGAALTLSGHTHWGQFALPTIGWSLATPFLQHAMGAYQEGEALLYVHPGTGFWGIPFRLGALPEVALITLRKAEQTGITMGEARAA